MGQVAKTFRKRIAKTIQCRYLLYLPPGYARAKHRWPLVLFLHGAGERGTDLSLVRVHGLPKLAAAGQQFPFLIVSPQCAPDQWWDPETLEVLLEAVMRQYRIDPARVYVTGLSMGGYGTWALALRFPHRFAAIAPICGGSIPNLAPRLKHLPIWVFHGAKDDIVPPSRSEEMVEALRECDGKVRFTLYPDAGHNSWSAAYENPELYDWLLSHRRKPTRTSRP